MSRQSIAPTLYDDRKSTRAPEGGPASQGQTQRTSMNSAGGHSTVFVLFCRTILWVAALLALGETASVADTIERHRPHYYLDSPLSPDDTPGNGIPGQVCSISSAVLPDDDISPPDFSEPLDFEWVVHAEARLSDVALTLGFSDRDHLVRNRPDTGGRHARGPPTGSPAA